MSDVILVGIMAAGVSLLVALVANFGSESYKRHRDSAALAGSLAGEIAAFEEGIDLVRETWPKIIPQLEEHGPLKFPDYVVPKLMIYEANAGKIGMLGPQLAEDVGLFYSRTFAFQQIARMAMEADNKDMQLSCFRRGLEISNLASERIGPLLGSLRMHAGRSWVTWGRRSVA